MIINLNSNPKRKKCTCGNFAVCKCGGCAIHCAHEESPLFISRMLRQFPVRLSGRAPKAPRLVVPTY